MDSLSHEQRCDVMNEVIVPRPIAWVVTDCGREQPGAARWNLAPYSYFNAVASDPPTVVIGINNRDSRAGLKDTVRNLRQCPAFTISTPSAGMIDDVQATSTEFPWGVSEAADLGVALQVWPGWPVPRVEQCALAFACTLSEEIQLDVAEQQSLIVARIERVHVASNVVAAEPGFHLDLAVLRPVARAGHGQFLEMSRIQPVGRQPSRPTS